MEEDSDRDLLYINSCWPELEQDNPISDTPIPASPSSQKQTVDLSDLHQAKQRFIKFVDSIGDLKKTAIRPDIVSYCSSLGKNQKGIDSYYRPQNLIKKIQIRIDKMIKTKRIKRNWGEDDLIILIWIISKYCELKHYRDAEKQIVEQDWKFIATLIPGVTPAICMFKWLSLKKITLAMNNWTTEESNLLSMIVNQRINQQPKHTSQIKDWKQISHTLYKMNTQSNKCFRNAKQCRQHWTCYLSPQLRKGPWQLHEDVKLLKFIKDNKGMKKWSEIAKCFDGRTENALKNRYTLIIDKQRKNYKNKHRNELQMISDYLQKCYVDQFTVEVQSDENIYEEQSSMKSNQIENKNSYPHTSIIKKQELTYFQSPESVITPVRIEKVNMTDFSSMSLHIFRYIQPGIMQPNGTFKKINPKNHKEQP